MQLLSNGPWTDTRERKQPPELFILSRKDNAGFSQRSRKNIGALNQELPILKSRKAIPEQRSPESRYEPRLWKKHSGPASRKVEGSVNGWGGKARCEADGISDVRSRKEAKKDPRRPPLFELARRRRSSVPSESTVSFDLAHAPSPRQTSVGWLGGRQRLVRRGSFARTHAPKAYKV